MAVDYSSLFVMVGWSDRDPSGIWGNQVVCQPWVKQLERKKGDAESNKKRLKKNKETRLETRRTVRHVLAKRLYDGRVGSFRGEAERQTRRSEEGPGEKTPRERQEEIEKKKERKSIAAAMAQMKKETTRDEKARARAKGDGD